MFYSLPASASLIVLSFAASVSSHQSGRLQQCWQSSVLAPTSGPHCSESDLRCICGSLNRNLNSLLECTRDTSQLSPLPPDHIRRAIDSRLVSCSSSSNQKALAGLQPNPKTGSSAAKGQIPINDANERSVVKRELGVGSVALVRRASTAAPATAETSTAPATAAPTSFLFNNGVGTGSLIPIYTDTPPLVVSDSATGTSSPAPKATGSSRNSGGTLLDTSAATSTYGGGRKRLVALTAYILACVAWF